VFANGVRACQDVLGRYPRNYEANFQAGYQLMGADDFAAVRDPARLAAMPQPDRQSWQAFWADVDALLAASGAK
jgi:hypothetical protein